MKNMIDEISENVTIESISIIFNKCMNYQNKYVNILIDNMEQFNSIETTYMQIKALLNPEYFVFGGKWLRKTQFEDFIFRNTKIFNSYKELANILFVESPSYSFFNVMNKDEQQQKGAGIYAAYSFFDWELKW